MHPPYTDWGDTVYLAGDLPAPGQWDPDAALGLSASHWPLWKASLELAADLHFEYKIGIRNANGVYWETGPNRSHTVSPRLQSETVTARCPTFEKELPGATLPED